MSNRDVELADLFKVTDTRLVKDVVVMKEICLADVSLAEAIKDRLAYALRTIADGIHNRLSLTRKLIGVRSILELQTAERINDATIRSDFQRLAHRRIQLRGLRRMTFDTRLIADIANTVRI
jgi:hypothetical protein